MATTFEKEDDKVWIENWMVKKNIAYYVPETDWTS